MASMLMLEVKKSKDVVITIIIERVLFFMALTSCNVFCMSRHASLVMAKVFNTYRRWILQRSPPYAKINIAGNYKFFLGNLKSFIKPVLVV